MDEHQQSLVNYIIQQLQIGQTSDEIFGQLQAAGWPLDRIQQAFLTVQAQALPTTMQTQPHPEAATVASEVVPQANGTRRGRVRTGWILLKQSVKLLNGNRYLFRYLLMTWVAIIVVMAALFLVIHFAGSAFWGANGNSSLQWYIFTFFSYVLVYFVINFYAAALAGNIFGIFKGERQPYHVYIQAARAKAGPIFVFSVIQAIVGMVLSYIVERIRFVGWIISWLLGVAWSLGTMFTLPIIISTDTSAPKAIKQSIRFFKQTWGESVVTKVTVNAALGLITLLLALICFPLLVILGLSGSIVGLRILLIAYLFLQLTLTIIGSFSNSVINAALYHYATTGQVPPGFSSDMLNQVFVKRKRRLFKKRSEAIGHDQVA